MLYTAPVIQRKLSIWICSALRTESTEAISVLANMAPVDLLMQKRTTTQGKETAEKRLARENTLEKWQSRWDAMVKKGAWTKKILPNLRPWLKRKLALTQLLSGHALQP